MKYLLSGLLGALLMYLIQGFISDPPKRIVIQEVVTDTLRVDVPVAPDTVWQEKVVRKLRTVYKDTGSTRIVERVVYRDTTLDMYVSNKTFEWPYVVSDVVAWGAQPVYEFDNQVVVKWDSYAEDNIYPKVQMQLKAKRSRGRWEGLIVGAVSVGAMVWLVK